MDKSLRNQLRNTVTAARKVLEGAISERLEGQFGIFPSGKVEEASQLGHLSAEDQGYRQQLVIHLEHIRAGGLKPKDAAEQLIREVAFTHLNRLCAYKLMEARGLIRESVSRGVKSQGFFFYLADHPEDEALANVGDTEKAYRHFLRWLSSSLSEELGALFAPDDPADRLYPPLRVLDQVLELLNAEELKAIWTEDETIGWVYQYFTPKELREQARKESSAPRNSYELAFRNQFYTPRYVVEFLTDNTLGRTWYEMRQGNTGLVETCRYLVRRPNEVWLKQGEEVQPGGAENTESEKTQEELLKEPVHIPFRALKDPRDLKILDPACGSGHFLLYCFDLLEHIYAEAWQDCPQVFTDLRGELSEAEFLRRVPGMILRHNLHGIDIDLRATQIASLALWLRAQKAYQALGLRREERPRITRANIVCAEPMPGEPELLEEFCSDLQPPLIGQLVKTIFEKMKLAGEAGSLLKIEQELEEAIQAAKAQMDAQPQAEQLAFWPAAPKPKQMAFDLRGIAKSDAEFWQTVEKRVLEALQEYAARAVNGQGYRRKLFAEDTENGFAYIDLCRKMYDVVLMNPPFGDASRLSVKYIHQTFPNTKRDLGFCFIDRWKKKSLFIGVIASRTCLFLSSYEEWRKDIYTYNKIFTLADLGFGVLDGAFVETSAFVITQDHSSDKLSTVFRLVDFDEKQPFLQNSIEVLTEGQKKDCCFITSTEFFLALPGGAFSYWAPIEHLKLFLEYPSIYPQFCQIHWGLFSADDNRFLRLWWEVPADLVDKRWVSYAKGGDYAEYYSPPHLVVDWKDEGLEIRNNKDQNGIIRSRVPNSEYYLKHGLTYSSVTVKGFAVRLLPANCIFSIKGPGIITENDDINWKLLGYLNSRLARQLMLYQTPSRSWDVSLVRRLPTPINLGQEFIQITKQRYLLAKQLQTSDETSRDFCSLNWINQHTTIKQSFHSLYQEKKHQQQVEVDLGKNLDQFVEVFFGVTISDEISEEISEEFSQEGEEGSEQIDETLISFTAKLLSSLIGFGFGRWDIRIGVLDSKNGENNLFSAMPAQPIVSLSNIYGLPAQPDEIVSEAWLRARPDAITLPETVSDHVVGKDGELQPATIPDEEYPIRIAWDGILVDDPDHPDDIVTRSHDVLELLFPGRGEAVEQETCQVLGVKTLREYFRKPGAGGFWMDHIKRYSKSRRKAPIYWLLQSNRKNYALWLYYHRLDKDLLFKALTQYVEPKIRLEEEQLKTLRAQRGTFGTGGRQAKELDQDMERQADLLLELEDFRDKLRRAADLGLEPDLNDGVVLNIAPLWELVPWNEAKKYWQELLEGKYEWSSIGKQLRKKGLILEK